MLSLIKISGFPPIAKLFVAIFTTLMLAICAWALWIYTVEKGEVDQSSLPLYLQEEPSTEIPNANQPEKAEPLETEPEDEQQKFRKNLGLAHTHVNGQTLLFFALSALFIFTTVKHRVKMIILWVFGISILVHAVGLSGEGFHWLFDDMLAVSGVVMLILIVYMCLMIYMDLGRMAGDRDSSEKEPTA